LGSYIYSLCYVINDIQYNVLCEKKSRIDTKIPL